MKTETAAELKKLRDTVAAFLAALAHMGRPIEKWDDWLVYVIRKNLVPARVTSRICNAVKQALIPRIPRSVTL